MIHNKREVIVLNVCIDSTCWTLSMSSDVGQVSVWIKEGGQSQHHNSE